MRTRLVVWLTAMVVCFVAPIAYAQLSSDPPWVQDEIDQIDARAKTLPPEDATAFKRDAMKNLEIYRDLVENPQASKFCREVVLNEEDSSFCLELLSRESR